MSSADSMGERNKQPPKASMKKDAKIFTNRDIFVPMKVLIKS